jgi:hypothetical protein
MGMGVGVGVGWLSPASVYRAGRRPRVAFALHFKGFATRVRVRPRAAFFTTLMDTPGGHTHHPTGQIPETVHTPRVCDTLIPDTMVRSTLRCPDRGSAP